MILLLAAYGKKSLDRELSVLLYDSKTSFGGTVHFLGYSLGLQAVMPESIMVDAVAWGTRDSIQATAQDQFGTAG